MRRGLLAALLAGTAGGPLLAQTLEGSTLSARVSQRLEADTNFDLDDPSPGTSYFTDSRLELGFLNETPNQAFELGLDTVARALWEAEEDFEFSVGDPTTVSGGYAVEWAAGAFSADGSFRRNQVGFLRGLDEFLDPDTGLPIDDIEDRNGDAIEERTEGSLSLDLATDAPSSYSFALDANNYDYSETGSSQTARSTVSGEAVWSLQLNPVLASAVAASYSRYSAESARDLEIRLAEIDAGVIYDASEVLQLAVGLGYAERTREETLLGVREETNDTGPTLRGSLDYDFEEFVVRANARVSAAAPSTRVDGDLRVVYPLPRGRVNARVFRRYSGSSEGSEVQVTGAGIGVERDINTVSTLGLDFAFAQQTREDDEDAATDAADVSRLDASATYSYALTEVVDLDVGYNFRNREDEGSATSHAVFVEIGRSFETRP